MYAICNAGSYPYWNGTQDHSKWACANPNYPNGYEVIHSADSYASGTVSMALLQGEELSHSLGPMTNFSCVGDVNRMCSQETRGGGALCTVDDSLWHAFNTSIRSLEPCYMVNPCTPYAYPTPAPSPSNAPSSQCYWCSYTPSPSASPTLSPSILLANFSETYTASNTASASTSSPNSVLSSVFYLCSELTASTCAAFGGSYTGSTYFRLIDLATGAELASADDSACGGSGSELLNYSPPASSGSSGSGSGSGSGCSNVFLSLGCAGTSTCSATIQVSFVSIPTPATDPTKAPSSSRDASAAGLSLSSTDGVLAYIVAPIIAGCILVALMWAYRHRLLRLCGGPCSDYEKADEEASSSPKSRNPSTASALSFVEDSPDLNPKDKGGYGYGYGLGGVSGVGSSNANAPAKTAAIPLRIPKSQSNPLLKSLTSPSDASLFTSSSSSDASLDGHYEDYGKRVKSLDYTSSSPGML